MGKGSHRRKHKHKKKKGKYKMSMSDHGGSGFTLLKDCHKNPTKLLQINKASLYAASGAARFDMAAPDVLIDMSNWFKPPVIITGDKFPNFQQVASCHVVRIDWPDYGVPRLGKRSWAALYEDLKSVDGTVLISCTGGHGRTGTLMAILAGLHGIKGNPIKYVRKNYCYKAVETFQQEDYVYEMTGFDSDSDPIDTIPEKEKVSNNRTDSMADYHKSNKTYLDPDMQEVQLALEDQRGLQLGVEKSNGVYRQTAVIDDYL